MNITLLGLVGASLLQVPPLLMDAHLRHVELASAELGFVRYALGGLANLGAALGVVAAVLAWAWDKSRMPWVMRDERSALIMMTMAYAASSLYAAGTAGWMSWYLYCFAHHYLDSYYTTFQAASQQLALATLAQWLMSYLTLTMALGTFINFAEFRRSVAFGVLTAGFFVVAVGLQLAMERESGMRDRFGLPSNWDYTPEWSDRLTVWRVFLHIGWAFVFVPLFRWRYRRWERGEEGVREVRLQRNRT